MAEQAGPNVTAPGTSSPDVMNDPQYATNTPVGDDGMGDADTCRICRGEGSGSEPLFHPCKCSGSIKFVHQDCLMEWLSHSQKKHCELCKTAFRFTKLYSPNMPQTLPLQVLARHAIIHTVKNLATWLRFCLVVTVWLGFLPYVIRQVWRLLFWFSDGGWPTNSLPTDSYLNSTATQALELVREFQQLESLAATGTTPVTPLQASQTTSASIGGIMDKFLGFLMPISDTLNISTADPLTAGLIKTLYYGFGISNLVLPEGAAGRYPANTTLSQYFSGPPTASRSSSLLSEFSFLQNLTRHPAINQLVITIAEGYIITILVVVCFILVFLIREWVVQQQPGINMGAGFNADFAGPDRPREQMAVAEARQEVARPPNGAGINENERREAQQRPMARPRRRNNHLDVDDGRPQDREELHEIQATAAYADGTQPRPIPITDGTSAAAEMERIITEEPRMTEEFLAIWRRADSDPREVLRIIERENKVDQMRYWVNAMKILQNPVPQEGGIRVPRVQSPSGSSSENANGAAITTSPLAGSDTASLDTTRAKSGSDKGSSGSDSWIDVPQAFNEIGGGAFASSSEIENRRAVKRGKMKATDKDPDSIFLRSRTSHASSSSRPRAISDGPQPKDIISPLANNNWSFSALQDDDEKRSNTFAWNDENKKPSETDLKEIFSEQDPSLLPFLKPDPQTSDKSWKEIHDSRVQEASTSTELDWPVMPAGENISIGLPLNERKLEDPIHTGDEESNPRIVENWQEVENPSSDGNAFSDSESGEEVAVANPTEPEPNTFQPDVPLLEVREPIVPRNAEPQGLFENIAGFLWGGIGDDGRHDEPGPNDEHIVQDLAAEAPFVPVLHHNAFEQGGEFEDQDREVVEAAIAAGLDPNDPDVIEDAEDFEGIMELIGMRGPIFSLFQNALFSAFLLALTVGFGVWIPYNIGRVSLLLIANPGPAFKLPLRLIFECAAFMQDLALLLMGLISYCLITMISFPLKIWSSFASITNASSSINGFGIGAAALDLSHSAMDRIMDGAVSTLVHITDSELFAFSAASHESLETLKGLVIDTLAGIGSMVIYIFVGDYEVTWELLWGLPVGILKHGWQLVATLPSLLAKPDSWVISLEVGQRTTPLNLELGVWDGMDRFLAVIAGYTALSVLGALYVRKGSPFSTGQVGREWEATVIDLLNQAGGVMKVILIISIEMLVFPLYCGLLLDAALLPLFENTTIMSRILFTFNSPLTSIFVHWFVGTCYMFHFALFVSMCRKIMRKGVLYFIRDPDDPTFHPVRDVLERNVATQLRKILFSALVYGGLVVICLGGVVWGLALTFQGVLPIHWSSNEPVLEFPIDLLFYNFLMPLAVNFFKPSDGLHAMYSWWFRQCARMLRLTWFMFDERKQDEEGHMVRRTLGELLRGATADPTKPIKTEDINQPFTDNPELRAYFRQDGRYVRAPASDQVRIPKGTRIFLEVDDMNNRTDGKWDRLDGVHGKNSDLYKQVYIPPWFRLRICLFIISIWFFAAFTGVCVTIVPLVFGRHVFAKIIPTHLRKNDVYAFSIGVYILGSALYAIVHLGKFVAHLRTTLAIDANTPKNVLRRINSALSWTARITWTYSAFVFVLPTLFAFLIEFYLIVPLHTYFALEERHTVHFVQTWTLGLLYVKLLTRLILWHENSRPAQSLRAITRGGYMNPDARLATRSFILPLGLVLCTALAFPWFMAKFVTATFLKNSPETHLLAYRYAYPFCLCMGCVAVAIYILLGWLKGWRMKIRDEVYLIGERLHNFGDRKTSSSGVNVPIVRRIET